MMAGAAMRSRKGSRLDTISHQLLQAVFCAREATWSTDTSHPPAAACGRRSLLPRFNVY